ncbi:MAG: hypothetical protein ACYTG0_17755 [Planctomycetota bacterium]|jgi:Leucine-rich repeat (LRR) protein
MARETTKPKSRWLPWLVVLGMFIVLVVLPFGIWLGVQSYRASRFRQAVEAIEAMGGRVGWDRGPEWLHSLFGEYFCVRAPRVTYPRGASDEALVHLGDLRGAETLDLIGTQVTDAGLAEVARLRGLETLALAGAPITDTGVAQLPTLEQLSTLYLDYTAVTDKGLQALARLPALDELSLVDTHVTKGGASRFATARPDVSLTWRTSPSEAHRRAAGALLRSGCVVYAGKDAVCTCVEVGHLDAAGDPINFSNLEKLDDLRELFVYEKRLGVVELEILGRLQGLECLVFDLASDSDLAHLGGLKSLKSLDLRDTQITDAGLEYLKTLTNLKWLDLCDTQVTDAGLEYLKALTNLEHLHLGWTHITDAGLVHLGGLVNLRDLQLSGTDVTDKAVEKLDQALPNVSISR